MRATSTKPFHTAPGPLWNHPQFNVALRHQRSYGQSDTGSRLPGRPPWFSNSSWAQTDRMRCLRFSLHWSDHGLGAAAESLGRGGESLSRRPTAVVSVTERPPARSGHRPQRRLRSDHGNRNGPLRSFAVDSVKLKFPCPLPGWSHD